VRTHLLAMLLASSQCGCSFFVRTVPSGAIERPDAPVECNDSYLPPMIDTALAVAWVGLGIAAFAGSNATNLEGAGAMIGAACFGGFAALGYVQRSRCEAFKVENSACIAGDGAACVRLNPKWVPPSPPPAGPRVESTPGLEPE
jgi:hypothetical protein